MNLTHVPVERIEPLSGAHYFILLSHRNNTMRIRGKLRAVPKVRAEALDFARGFLYNARVFVDVYDSDEYGEYPVNIYRQEGQEPSPIAEANGGTSFREAVTTGGPVISSLADVLRGLGYG